MGSEDGTDLTGKSDKNAEAAAALATFGTTIITVVRRSLRDAPRRGRECLDQVRRISLKLKSGLRCLPWPLSLLGVSKAVFFGTRTVPFRP
jgi:hypothetical protein